MEAISTGYAHKHAMTNLSHAQNEVSDEELASRAIAGDMGAFDALVMLFSDRVFGLSFRFLGDRAEAEDLSQEVFVAIYNNLHTFRGESKLSTWIYRITKNRCLNRIKYLERRHQGRMLDVDDEFVGTRVRAEDFGPNGHKSPVRKMENDQLSALLQAHLDLLPEEQRLLLALRDLEDLTYEEIVEITDLPLGTVKSRIHRARSSLAKTLGPVLQELK